MSALATFIVLEVLDIEIREEKLLQFADDMILYTESTENDTRKY